MDIGGLLWGMLFYTIAFIVSLSIFSRYSPLYKRPCLVMMMCCIGHFVAAYFYSQVPSDSSTQFFPNATPIFYGLGTGFVENMTWYVRLWITGDSYVATILFFSAFSYLGSVLWYVIYIELSKRLEITNQRYIYPAMVLMCWPSYLLFTSGIGKDSLSFFLLPAILLFWDKIIYQKRIKFSSICYFFLCMTLLVAIRPYLLMLLTIAYFMSLNKGIKKISAGRFFVMLLFAPLLMYIIKWVLETQGNMSDLSISDIALRASIQQENLNTGTSFPILSTNPIMTFLLLPYGFLMNLFMPLFIFANNATGILASIENAFLIGIFYNMRKRISVYKTIKEKSDLACLCFNFFLVGMAYLGLCNTNLGLAMRQKSMYVPSALIIAMLTWLYDKHQVGQCKKVNLQVKPIG